MYIYIGFPHQALAGRAPGEGGLGGLGKDAKHEKNVKMRNKSTRPYIFKVLLIIMRKNMVLLWFYTVLAIRTIKHLIK